MEHLSECDRTNFSGTDTGTFFWDENFLVPVLFWDQIFPVPVPVPSKKKQNSWDRDVTLWHLYISKKKYLEYTGFLG